MSEQAGQVRLEVILSRANLKAAWSAVVANKGAAGVDGLGIEETRRHLRRHWPGIREKLMHGRYRPAAVRSVEIPKGNGGRRLLGIPTVQDRLIQQALHQIMSAAFDAQMSEHSYGFRPNRSAHDAVAAARTHIVAGKPWVVDIDLKNFFDQVNHDRLLDRLGRRIEDKRVLALIGRYLRAPRQQPGERPVPRTRGTPQGGPLSPLLANLYLEPLDRELERRGVAFVRYADDIALFAASERAARRLLVSVSVWLRTHLDLVINDDKSGVSRSGRSKLLGFCIHEDGAISPAASAIEKLKDRVRQLWDARQNATSQQLREHWQRYIRGWWNYFALADRRWALRRLSGWIRRHMRKCFWLRWHNRPGRYRAFYRLGIRGRLLGVAGCRRGAWAMAIHVALHQALSTRTLNRHGLIIPWELAG